MDNAERGRGSSGGWVVAVVIALVALAWAANTFRPEIASAWEALTEPSEAEQKEQVRAAVARYVNALDDREDKYEEHLNSDERLRARVGATVTQSFWDSPYGSHLRDLQSAPTERPDWIGHSVDYSLSSWEADECCENGARGTAKAISDFRTFDPENPDKATSSSKSWLRQEIELAQQDGEWKVSSAEVLDGEMFERNGEPYDPPDDS